jgi:hypothetical protein
MRRESQAENKTKTGSERSDIRRGDCLYTDPLIIFVSLCYCEHRGTILLRQVYLQMQQTSSEISRPIFVTNLTRKIWLTFRTLPRPIYIIFESNIIAIMPPLPTTKMAINLERTQKDLCQSIKTRKYTPLQK